ncbi:MAG: CBS domain-containing protein [Candidatus Methanophagaceae archaeon]|nr:MAG: CBS domain-containing protein [Methanophagales archaeon]
MESSEGVREYGESKKGKMKEKVEEIMTREVVTVKEEDTVVRVAEVFREKKISGAPVVNERGEVVGVVSEADILKLLDNFKWYTPFFTALEILHLRGRGGGGEKLHDLQQEIERAGETRVKEVMSKDPRTVSPNTSIDDAAFVMHYTGFNRLPVVDSEGTGRLVGIVTRADIIASLYDV